MEGVTNEIRNKIKCAVKAKLQEIGAYVDEELPDYIMVMIANRRSKTQMTSELSLFLGSHTDKFTDWLHVVLEKLEAYVVSTSDKNKESIPNTTKPGNDTFVLPTNVQDSSAVATHQHSGLLTEKMTQTKTNVVTQNTLKKNESQDKYVPTPVSVNPHPSKVQQQPIEDMDEDCLNIREEIEQEFHAEDKLPKRNVSSTAYKTSFSEHKKRRHTRSADSRDTKKFRREEKSRPRRTEGRISSQVVSVVRPMLSQVVKPGERNRTKVENGDHEENNLNSKNGVNSIVRVTARRKLPAKMQATNSLILKAVAEAQKSVITCPPKVEPESKPLPALFTRKYREKNLNVQTVAVTISNSNVKPPSVNNEMNECSMEVDDQPLIGQETNPTEVEGPDLIRTTVEEPEESSADAIEGSESPVFSHIVDQHVETRFIVTLDGAHPQMSRCFDEDLNDEDATEMTELDDTGRKPVKSRLFRRRSTGTEAEVQQTLERCKFWPNCRQGTRCSFHHPKTMCKNFPNCLFGENCLFIHPQCKFDTTCTRKSCPYTHSLRTKAVVPVPPTTIPVKLHPQPQSVVNGKTVCKFFPACNNVSCVFFHPPACKYGSNCTRIGCTFSHPNSIPSANKLKWVTSTK